MGEALYHGTGLCWSEISPLLGPGPVSSAMATAGREEAVWLLGGGRGCSLAPRAGAGSLLIRDL